jgi:cytochrome P450 family 135
LKQTLPPGPPWPPLVQGVAMWTRPLASYERARAKYGKRFTIRLPFTPPFVIHSDPDHVKEIFTAPPEVLHPGEGARVLEPLVGANSVILLDGDAHMEQRKLILPAFHGERMERLTDLVTRVTEEEIASWDRGEVKLHPRFQALTLEIILRAVFGLDPGTRLDSLRDDLSTLLSFGDSPLTLITPPTDPQVRDRQLKRFNQIGPLKGFLDMRNRIDAALAELVTERRAEGAADRDDVLAMLLEARHEDDGSEMTQQELRDELMTLLVAGHETTASTLAWAFERITREPAVLERLAEEAASDDDSPYVLATIQETLRRRPVLPNTAPRLVKQPVTVGGWDYEPGCSLVANAYLVHHDPETYPDPYAFRPERFVDKKPGTYTWIPFGGGRRRCIGMSFAMLEMRIVIRELLRAYEVRAADPDHEVPGRRNISITPSRGSRAGLKRRARVPVGA